MRYERESNADLRLRLLYVAGDGRHDVAEIERAAVTSEQALDDVASRYKLRRRVSGDAE